MTNILAKKAVLASLNLSYWGARSLDHKITDEVHKKHDAAHDSGRYTKRLVTREMLKPITTAMGATRAFHYSRTMPWLDNGARLLPAAFYLDYAKDMNRHRRNYDQAADEFCKPKEWDAKLRQMEKLLGSLYDKRDYPTAEQVRRAFRFDLVVMQCPDIEDFRIALSKEQAEEVKLDLEKRLDETLRGTQRDMAERIAETVGRMAERLKAYQPATDETGAQNTFRDSLVGNVRELAELLPAFNLAEDKKLADIVGRIQRDLCTTEAEALRGDDATREKVAKAADKILKDVSAFMS